MANRTDDFNRADGGIGTPSDAGSAWVQQSGTWVIESNKAKLSSGTSQASCVLESSAANVDVQVTLSGVMGGADVGLVARSADDNNHLVIVIGESSCHFYTKVSGTFTAVGSAVSITLVTGDVWLLSLNGTSVVLKQNGTTRKSETISTFSTNTKHGLRSNTITYISFDDFSITDLGGGGGSAIPINVISPNQVTAFASAARRAA